MAKSSLKSPTFFCIVSLCLFLCYY